jgi:hypothetical protein
MSGNTSATGGFLIPASGMSRRDIESLIHALISGLTGIPGSLVRPRWQPDPPTQPGNAVNWAAFGIIQRETLNFPQLVHDPVGDGRGELHVHETLRCLASFYGPDAEDKALALRNGLHIGQNREPLYHAGMAFVEAGALVYLPEIRSMEWRARCDLPLVFRRGPAPKKYGVSAEGSVPVLNVLEAPACPGECMTDTAPGQ